MSTDNTSSSGYGGPVDITTTHDIQPPPVSPPQPTQLEQLLSVPVTPTYDGNYTPNYGGGEQPNMDAILQAVQSAVQYINDAKSTIAQQLATGCSGCIDKVSTVQQSIYDKIGTVFNNLTSCYSNCQQSISSQLGGQYTNAMGNANNVICNCPTCPTEQPITQTSVTIQGRQLTPSQEQELKAYDTQLLDGSITQQQYNEYIAKFFTPPPVVPPPVVPVPNINIPVCPTTPPTRKCHRWIGYCNVDDGGARALRDDDLPPGGPWKAVSEADDEENALVLALDYCQKEDKKPKPYLGLGELQTFYPLIATCDIATFRDRNKIAQALSTTKLTADEATLFGIVHDFASGLAASIKDLPIAGAIGKAIGGFIESPMVIAKDVLPQLAKILGCNDGNWENAILFKSIISYFENNYGIDISPFLRPFDYVAAMYCRNRHIEPGEALRAYLSDRISEAELDTLWGIHGYCPEDVRWSIDTNKTKLSAGELMLLRRRGTISESEYYAGMRKIGYIDRSTQNDLYTLATELPPVQDIIRFMVRDTDDKEIVDSLHLDALFDHKFGPQLKQWAKQRGIPDDMMQHEWRAHWTIPSPTQLFTFWQRLRRNKQFGTPEEQRSKIEKALVHNDILPTWFDSYFAVQYRPIGRRDLRTGFNTGTLNEQQVNDGFAAIGYSDADSENLTKITKQQRLDAAGNSKPIRLWTTLAISADDCKARLDKQGFNPDEITEIMADAEHKLVTSYPIKSFVAGTMPFPVARLILSDLGVTNDGIDQMHQQTAELVHSTTHTADYETGIATRQETEQAMSAYGVGTNRIRTLLDAIDNKLSRMSKDACIRGIKRNFATGGIDNQQATNQLIGIGITLERANMLVDMWNCENVSKSKAIPATKLCEWLSNGSITSTEFVDRLTRIGYSEFDANTLLGDCLKRINENLSKQELRRVADRVKAEKQAQQQADKVAKAIAREQDQLAKARVAASKAKLNRQKQLTTAAGSVQKACKCDLETALATIQLANDTLKTDYGFGTDEALQLLVTTSAKWKGGDPQDYLHLVFGEATALSVKAMSDIVEPLVSVPSLNGSTQ